MQTYPKNQYATKSGYFLSFFIGIVLFVINNICFAGNVVITGDQIINKPTTYNNVVLDMTNGRFTITTGGSLEIKNSTINTTISLSNPYAILLKNGGLTLKNNTVNATVSGIIANPNVKAVHQLLQVQHGDVDIEGNTFTNATAFT